MVLSEVIVAVIVETAGVVTVAARERDSWHVFLVRELVVVWSPWRTKTWWYLLSAP